MDISTKDFLSNAETSIYGVSAGKCKQSEGNKNAFYPDAINGRLYMNLKGN